MVAREVRKDADAHRGAREAPLNESDRTRFHGESLCAVRLQIKKKSFETHRVGRRESGRREAFARKEGADRPDGRAGTAERAQKLRAPVARRGFPVRARHGDAEHRFGGFSVKERGDFPRPFRELRNRQGRHRVVFRRRFVFAGLIDRPGGAPRLGDADEMPPVARTSRERHKDVARFDEAAVHPQVGSLVHKAAQPRHHFFVRHNCRCAPRPFRRERRTLSFFPFHPMDASRRTRPFNRFSPACRVFAP